MMTKSEKIYKFCNILKNTHCQICEDCGTGVIVFSHDEYTFEAAVRFRVAKFTEDMGTAFVDASEMKSTCEDDDEKAFYESVAGRLAALCLLNLKTDDEE